MTTYKTHFTKEQLFELSEKGNSDAMYSIGYRYLKGIAGLPKNTDLATEWFKKAADAGNLNAIKILKKTQVSYTKQKIEPDLTIHQALSSFISETLPAQTHQLLT